MLLDVLETVTRSVQFRSGGGRVGNDSIVSLKSFSNSKCNGALTRILNLGEKSTSLPSWRPKGTIGELAMKLTLMMSQSKKELTKTLDTTGESQTWGIINNLCTHHVGRENQITAVIMEQFGP